VSCQAGTAGGNAGDELRELRPGRLLRARVLRGLAPDARGAERSPARGGVERDRARTSPSTSSPRHRGAETTVRRPSPRRRRCRAGARPSLRAGPSRRPPA
jgi:hypothetical protein